MSAISSPPTDPREQPSAETSDLQRAALRSTATTADASFAASDASIATGETVLPIVAEQLHVDKRAAETGVAYRVRKVVEDHEERVDVPLSRETFDIQRVARNEPVDGPLDIRQEGDVTIVPVLEERLVLERRLFLTEEIRIVRRLQTETQPQTGTVRRERAVIERRDTANGAWYEIDAADSAVRNG